MGTSDLEPRVLGEPGPAAERVVAIDVLRGFALLGILIMNVQSFAMIGMAYVNPHTYGDMTGLNGRVWFLSHVFADQKFMTIFSMLFGAGIVLMTGRQEEATGRSAAVHYRRMGILLVFGLLHAYLIWYGDILAAYALCGMVAYLFRRFRPVTLVIVGLLAIAVHSAINHAAYWSMPYWGQEAVDGFVQGMQPKAEEVQEELDIYRGPWLGQLSSRVTAALLFQTLFFLTWTFWRAGGLMLIGMALFKWGVFGARRSPALYWSMAAVGLGIGVPVIIHGHQRIADHNWYPPYTMFVGMEFNYWGSLFISLAYVGLVMLACQNPNLGPLTGPFAAVGRMALTNYLIQSVICTLIFYGHGFGYFGSVERVGQVGIVVGVWVFQLIVSPVWLRYFRFGPAEWLWRALTYWTLPPMRRMEGGYDGG